MMIHIHFDSDLARFDDPPASGTMCGRALADGDGYTDVALQSDCNDCRAALLIGPVGQLGCAVRPPVEYVPEPHPRAEEILRDVAVRKSL
jgi:hypothetical protein